MRGRTTRAAGRPRPLITASPGDPFPLGGGLSPRFSPQPRAAAKVFAFLLLVARLVQAQVAPEVLDAERRRADVVARACQSTIAIFAPGGAGGGSGVLISPDGYALTNFHVVQPVGDYLRCGLTDGRLYDAVLVGADPVGDVALIKLLGRDDFPAATLGDSDRVRVGDGCYVIGNPFMLATDFQPSVSYGIISGAHRYQYPAGTLLEYADCLQTDAAINPGNSGGPLFNEQGELIGINGRASFEKRGRVNVGVGYAITINQIKNFLGHLRSGRYVDHATLGATVATDSEGRVIVTNILESSDAYRRGLRYGDEIVEFAGRPITSANALKNALGVFPKGWRAPLTYRREGRRRTIVVRLEGVHSPQELLAKVQMPVKPPDEQEPNKREGEQEEGGREQQPQRRPAMPGPLQNLFRAPPERVAKYIERRPGYANYYFNQLNQQRVWRKMVQAMGAGQGGAASPTGPSDIAAGAWLLKGVTDQGAAAELLLEEQGASCKLPSGPVAVDLSQGLRNRLAPAGSGGMLAALHLWRRFLLLGPRAFNDVYHLGSLPSPADGRVCDVLAAVYDVAELELLFDPDTGLLHALEAQLEAGSDPCILVMGNYGDLGGLRLPRRLAVFHGDQPFITLQIQSADLDYVKEEWTD